MPPPTTYPPLPPNPFIDYLTTTPEFTPSTSTYGDDHPDYASTIYVRSSDPATHTLSTLPCHVMASRFSYKIRLGSLLRVQDAIRLLISHGADYYHVFPYVLSEDQRIHTLFFNPPPPTIFKL